MVYAKNIKYSISKVLENNKIALKFYWKSIKNIQVIETKSIENASIRSIYLDKNSKTIYVIAIGGN